MAVKWEVRIDRKYNSSAESNNYRCGEAIAIWEIPNRLFSVW
jgi:hypothetical protein